MFLFVGITVAPDRSDGTREAIRRFRFNYVSTLKDRARNRSKRSLPGSRASGAKSPWNDSTGARSPPEAVSSDMKVLDLIRPANAETASVPLTSAHGDGDDRNGSFDQARNQGVDVLIVGEAIYPTAISRAGDDGRERRGWIWHELAPIIRMNADIPNWRDDEMTHAATIQEQKKRNPRESSPTMGAQTPPRWAVECIGRFRTRGFLRDGPEVQSCTSRMRKGLVSA